MKSLSVLLVLGLAACTAEHQGPQATGSAAGTSGESAGSSNALGGASANGEGSGGSAASAGTTASAGAPTTPLPPSQIPPVDTSAVVIPNLDSAVININPVEGAKEYRAFVVKDGVEILTDASDREVVNGATIYCAGQRQHSAPALTTPEVMKQIEVLDIHEPTDFVVEAIDQLCPFPGIVGLSDATVAVTSPDATADLKALPMPIVTEAGIRAKYGSMFINGQGPSTTPGQPAAPNTPKVLKRWTVRVAPLDEAAAAKRRTSTFFADFSKPDPFEWVPPGPNDAHNDDGTWHGPEGFGYSIGIYQNSQFSAYTTNTETIKGNNFFVDRGMLRSNLPDLWQDVMGTLLTIPKKPAQFKDDAYLHVTFETSTNSTARRYWWLSLCGAANAGETLTPQGLLTHVIALPSGFWNPDAPNPTEGNWNCLIVFPHDGLGTPVPATAKTNPESSLIVLIHKGGAPKKQSAVNVSPQQLSAAFSPAWFRQMKGGQVTDTGILDDLIGEQPRAHFDFYVSRQRVIMYVNGGQRMCNDFGPEKLTMAEAAVGFNDALYHSSAEHSELMDRNSDRTGQFHYIKNTIFADAKGWDNVGFEEGVALPDSFNGADCYTYKP